MWVADDVLFGFFLVEAYTQLTETWAKQGTWHLFFLALVGVNQRYAVRNRV